MGEDSRGIRFSSVGEFWKSELSSPAARDVWYNTSIDYWTQSEASVNGVLSGHAALSPVDIEGSHQFLNYIKQKLLANEEPCVLDTVLDCGAGVGRVTEGVLLRHFKNCDLLEPVPHLLEKAKEDFKNNPSVTHFYCSPLQDFTPPRNRYDCFWVQWCALYLTDDDLVACLRRLRSALKPNGIICIKENVILSGKDFQLDREDNSLMRTDCHYRQLFKEAGMEMYCHMRQFKYPRSLVPVMMYCLR